MASSVTTRGRPAICATVNRGIHGCTCWNRRSTASELLLGIGHLVARRGLPVTREDAGGGRRFGLVALPDGGAFDLLGMGG